MTRIVRKVALGKRERDCHNRSAWLGSGYYCGAEEGHLVRIGPMIGPERGRHHEKVTGLVVDAEASPS
jgi:hypothetical protein